MELSISSLYFGDLAPQEAIRLFAQHGWRCLELSEGHVHKLMGQGNPARAGQGFRQFAADHGVSVPQGHLPAVWYHAAGTSPKGYLDIAPASDEELAQAQDELKKALDLFSVIGVRYAVLHMGGYRLKDAGWSEQALFARRVEAIAGLAIYAASLGITICLENMFFPNCGVETADKIKALIAEAAVDGLGICLDTGHAVLAGTDPVAFISAAGSLIKTVHIHENGGASDEHLLPYERGTIPWDRFLCELAKIGYQGTLNLEILGHTFCPMPIREARLDYARALASYMAEQARCISGG